jgi:hypothetical protein
MTRQPILADRARRRHPSTIAGRCRLASGSDLPMHSLSRNGTCPIIPAFLAQLPQRLMEGETHRFKISFELSGTRR